MTETEAGKGSKTKKAGKPVLPDGGSLKAHAQQQAAAPSRPATAASDNGSQPLGGPDTPAEPRTDVEICASCGRRIHEDFDPTPYLVNLHRTKSGEELDPPWMYLEVQWRVAWFRAENPKGIINPRPIEVTPEYAFFECTVTKEDGTWVVGHGSATGAGSGHYGGRIAEKAATAAIGRAMAYLGYGTQFTDQEFSEDLIDSPPGARGPIATPQGQGRPPVHDKPPARPPANAPAAKTPAQNTSAAAKAKGNFWAEATAVLKMKEAEVYAIFGIDKDSGGFTDAWLNVAAGLGISEGAAWGCARTCLRQMVGDVRSGSTPAQAHAVVEPLKQLERLALKKR